MLSGLNITQIASNEITFFLIFYNFETIHEFDGRIYDDFEKVNRYHYVFGITN